MLLNLSDFFFLILLVLLVCVKCDELKTQKPSSLDKANPNTNSEIGQLSNYENGKTIETSSTLDPKKQIVSSVTSSLTKVLSTPQKSSEKEVHRTVNRNQLDLSKVPLEGGGIGVTFQNSINITENGQVGIQGFEDETLGTGSKGRKGVKPPNSTLPRKGVTFGDDSVRTPQSNSTPTGLNRPTTSGVHHSFTDNQTKSEKETLLMNTNLTKNVQIPKKVDVSETQQNSFKKVVHSKKPEYLSDESDADYSDKYSLIHTSTTGEDYVIIGIVIVIGVWFSVFGALIFYRRAGEYWDRRHYRRMDFLVEGMYND